MRRLSALDLQFLGLEDGRNHGHVAGLHVYDPSTAPSGRLGREEVLEHLRERLPMLTPLRWRLVQVPLHLGRPYWVDDQDFDLDFHVRELALATPGSDAQLAEQVARLHARPLDRDHPLWEVYVIEGLHGGRVAIFFKLHHAAVDGLSSAELLAHLLDLAPEGRAVEQSLPAPETAPGTVGLLARGIADACLYPARALGVLPRTLAHLDGNPAFRTVPGAGFLARAVRALPVDVSSRNDGGILEAPAARAPQTVFNSGLSAHRRVAFRSLSLSDVKTVKNAFGCTVNDVIVSLCAGALRTVLQDQGELPEEDLVAMVPVSVRTAEQQGTFGNRVSAMFVPLPTGEPDPIVRLARMHEVLASAKARHRAVPADVLVDTATLLPTALVGRASRTATRFLAWAPVAPPCNVIVSNVPGPPVPLYFRGARMVAHYPISAVNDFAGLNITVLSYQDSVDVGVVVDREQLADAWPVVDALEGELHRLLELATDARSERAASQGPGPG